MQKTVLSFAIPLLILMLLFTGCAQNEAQQKSIPTFALKTEPVISHNIAEMEEKSDLIVMGSYQKYLGHHNGARNPNNIKKPSPTQFSETKKYAFQVEKTLKGKAPSNSIQINLHASRIEKSLKDEKGNPLQLKVPSPFFIEPAMGKKVILFLKKSKYDDAYNPSSIPHAISIDGGLTKLIKPLGEHTKLLKDSKGKQYSLDIEGFPENYQDQISGKPVTQLIEWIVK